MRFISIQSLVAIPAVAGAFAVYATPASATQSTSINPANAPQGPARDALQVEHSRLHG
jgi:hypothetical protein